MKTSIIVSSSLFLLTQFIAQANAGDISLQQLNADQQILNETRQLKLPSTRIEIQSSSNTNSEENAIRNLNREIDEQNDRSVSEAINN